MMILVYFFLFLLLLFLLVGAGIIRTVLRVLFGGSGGNRPAQGGRQGETRWYTYRKRKKKVFDDTDGEYVEFEDIQEQEGERRE